jgi:hypothetical protein
MNLTQVAVLRVLAKNVAKQTEIMEEQNRILGAIADRLGWVDDIPENAHEETSYEAHDDEKEGLEELKDRFTDYGWPGIESPESLR